MLLVLLAVLGGGGWLGCDAARPAATDGAGGRRRDHRAHRPTPALERVVPSLAGVRTPDAAAPRRLAAAGGRRRPRPPAPRAGRPVHRRHARPRVRAPGVGGRSGSKPTFELVVTNTSAVPCVRALDKGLQELVLLDGAGTRVWGSNDCFPEASSDTRTLAPGEVVAFPVSGAG